MHSSPAVSRLNDCARRDLRRGDRSPTTSPRAVAHATAALNFTLCLPTDTSLGEGHHGLSLGENPVPAGAGRRLRRLVHLLVVPPSLRGRDARVRALARRLRGAPGGTPGCGSAAAARAGGGNGRGGAQYRRAHTRARRSGAAAIAPR